MSLFQKKLIALLAIAVIFSFGMGYMAGSASSGSEAAATAEIEARDRKIEKLEKEIERLYKKKSSSSMKGAFDEMKNMQPSGKGHKIDPNPFTGKP